MSQETVQINRLQLKALLLSTIMEIKCGQGLAPNASAFKSYFKSIRGLAKRTSNVDVIKEIGAVYKEVGLQEEYDRVIKSLNVTL